MNKLLISVSLLSALYVSGCAQTHEEIVVDEALRGQAVNPASEDVIIKQHTPVQTADKGVSPKMAEESIVDQEKSYWVKKPGTLVYNGAHEITRSLRLQPKVSIYKEADGWGLIDPDKDEWVSMSDITTAKPAGMMDGPQERTGLPRISVEDMMKARNK